MMPGGRMRISLVLCFSLACGLTQAEERLNLPSPQVDYDPAAALTLGPRNDFGRQSLGQRAAGGLIDGLAGAAGLSTGRGQQRGPTTRRDPTRRLDFTFSSDIEAGLRVGARGRVENGGLLVSQRIESADERGTFHLTYLVNCTGEILFPSRIELFSMWSERGLSVSWSRTTAVDGRVIERQSGGFSHHRRTEQTGELVDYEEAESIQLGQPAGIWESFGFQRAYAGARSIGAWFELPDETFSGGTEAQWLLVTQVTRPEQDPVTTQPLAWRAAAPDPVAHQKLDFSAGAAGSAIWSDWQDHCERQGHLTFAAARSGVGYEPGVSPWRLIELVGYRAKLIQS